MKKSITRLLARVAKDGDIDTVAEFIGELIGGEDPVETPAETVAEAAEEAVEAVAEAVEAAAEEPVAGEPAAVISDEDGLAGVIERLDRIISLLTPAEPAADEDPAEGPEIPGNLAEIVEEAVEAAVAEAEAEGPAAVTEGAEEIAELVETVLAADEPDEPEEPEASGDCGNGRASNDSLKAVPHGFRSALSQMDEKQRKKFCTDISAKFPRRSSNGRDRHYAEAGGKPPVVSADLGKRIMAARNPHYHQ